MQNKHSNKFFNFQYHYRFQKPVVGHYLSSSAPTTTPSKFNNIRGYNVVNGDISKLPLKVKTFIEESVVLCQPERVHICDGSEIENEILIKSLLEAKTIIPLPKYENCYLARTNPADVARVESKTFICTEHREQAVCTPRFGIQGTLGNWISPEDYDAAIMKRFPGCMKGRTMYVVPFSMGPIASPLSKDGIQITDSQYVVCAMRIMTRMGSLVMDDIIKHEGDFVRCLHSVGMPENGKIAMESWPCDPERVIILHKPDNNEIVSYGSAYGGNAILGKKCFALRIGSTIAHHEGWLAEHMLILGVTCPNGTKKYIAAAFPSACGKTNLAMMKSTLPGLTLECVGDDIAWMKIDSHGQLRAINPENGFFGVAPGTSAETNPNALAACSKNTIFTNVASTSDGGVYWEGLEDTIEPGVTITDWLGNPWELGVSKTPAAHPNSRFCSPASNCPIIDEKWEDPEGVPISAILFGGRRPEGVPLIYEALNWQHGVFVGSAMRSESTAAAEYKGKVIMHDPMAMRPFFGYNFGSYLKHWLNMEKQCVHLGGHMPKIFHVNWFRKDSKGKFLWPGFGENSRVIDWILRRVDGANCFQKTPIGLVPTPESLKLDHLKSELNLEELFSIDREFWLKEVEEIQTYYDNQVGADLPKQIEYQLIALKHRIENMH